MISKRPKLKVEKRTILGKQVRKLRRDGILPANIYGKDVKSLAVQMPVKDFNAIFKEVGETGLIDVEVDGSTRPVLIHNPQFDHVSSVPLHADLYQVNLKEKIKTMVPLEIVGEPKAVTDKIGLLLQTLQEVEVEALPEDLPERIEVNVEQLTQVDDQVTVGDLKKPTGVSILTDESQVVAKISELVSKEAEEQMAQEAQAAEEAKAESESAKVEAAEGAQPEVPSQGEQPIEEKPAEKPQEEEK